MSDESLEQRTKYTIQSKPGYLKGYGKWGLKDKQRMDSRGEIILGQILHRNDIKHKPHVEYDVVDRQGDDHTYEIDFDFFRPHKLKGISHPVSALEYKGVMSEHDKDRMDWWEFCTDRNMYIVQGRSLLKYWSQAGMKDTRYENGSQNGYINSKQNDLVHKAYKKAREDY